MISLWKGKNPIYFGVISIIPFDNLYRRAYFVMRTIDIGLVFFILAEFMILYCKDSLGCIDNNNIELINKLTYLEL